VTETRGATLAGSGDMLPFRAGVEAHDLHQVVGAFTPDAVLRSPITELVQFRGHEEIAMVFKVLLDSLHEITYESELRNGNEAILRASARVGSRRLELIDHMRLNADGQIEELTVFFRPMASLVASALPLAAGVARTRGLVRALLIRMLVAPLIPIVNLGDRAVARLAKPVRP